MATLNCDLCEQAPADFMIGLILTGDQTTCCVRCLPSFTEAVTKTMEAAAVDAQTAATAAQLPPDGPEASWEDDDPQPTVEVPRRAARGRKSAETASAQAETSAADSE